MDAANSDSLSCEADIMVRGNFLKFRRVILDIAASCGREIQAAFLKQFWFRWHCGDSGAAERCSSLKA
jgi:hypothetical protein